MHLNLAVVLGFPDSDSLLNSGKDFSLSSLMCCGVINVCIAPLYTEVNRGKISKIRE